jgi:hypothetical protein
VVLAEDAGDGGLIMRRTFMKEFAMVTLNEEINASTWHVPDLAKWKLVAVACVEVVASGWLRADSAPDVHGRKCCCSVTIFARRLEGFDCEDAMAHVSHRTIIGERHFASAGSLASSVLLDPARQLLDRRIEHDHHRFFFNPSPPLSA